MTPHLRLFRAPDDAGYDSFHGPAPEARICLGELLPLLAIAQKMNFLWLKDFLDDEVRVSDDLYDVLQSIRGHRPSAS